RGDGAADQAGQLVVAGWPALPAGPGGGRGFANSGLTVARFESASTNRTVVTLTAANATYTGAPYDTANLTATVMPAAASGSVSYVFYSDAAGQNAIADPTNAGTYYVQAVFTS